MLYRQQEIAIYKNGKMEYENDNLVIEMPLTVYVNGKETATLNCSPGASLELGTGFLINEGWLQSPDQVKSVKADAEKGMFWLESYAPLSPDPNPHGRYINESSDQSKAVPYLNKDARQIKPVNSDAKFKASHLLRLIELLEEESKTFKLTGGVHSAALGGDQGLITRYEDIGRHNAVDKVIGYAFLNHIPLHDKVLVLSGRVATEILVKVARNGIPLLLSRSAAMYLAVQLAQQWNVCVVGFTRNQRFNIYSHCERILV